ETAAVGGADEVRGVLRLDPLRRLQDALQQFGPAAGLADGGEVRSECHPLVTDLVAFGALEVLREEQHLAALRVALQVEDRRRPRASADLAALRVRRQISLAPVSE